MSIDQIKAELAPVLNDCFSWEVGVVPNQDSSILFILLDFNH